MSLKLDTVWIFILAWFWSKWIQVGWYWWRDVSMVLNLLDLLWLIGHSLTIRIRVGGLLNSHLTVGYTDSSLRICNRQICLIRFIEALVSWYETPTCMRRKGALVSCSNLGQSLWSCNRLGVGLLWRKSGADLLTQLCIC